MTLTTFRHFCASSRVLDVYLDYEGSLIDSTRLCSSICTAVTLGLRTENVRLPDHQHRNRVENCLQGQHTLADMLLLALGVENSGCNAHGLAVHNGMLYVDAEQMEDWQRDVAAYQSPVPLLAAAWVRQCRQQGHGMHSGQKAIVDTLRYSSLPGIHDHRFNSLVQNEAPKSGNLCDLHVHINGSMEFTSVWLHSLAHPKETFCKLKKSYAANRNKVDFFLHQLRITPKDIPRRLRMALVLRSWLCRLLQTQHTHSSCEKNHVSCCTIAELFRTGRWKEEVSLKHPFTTLSCKITDLQREGAMWFEALRVLQETRNHFLAVLLHSYMLLMNQHMRLLVQQHDQYGFDQFQYITLAGGRDAAEDTERVGFASRFHQFHGMYGPDLAHIEARFSPKKTPRDNAYTLQRIWEGYAETTKGKNDDGIIPCPACPRIAKQFRLYNGEVRPLDPSAAQKEIPPSIRLIAHFIKRPDTGHMSCRHRALRDDIFTQAMALVAARKELRYANHALYHALAGKDAAANELDASAEVFAPAFRYLHRQGICHTTYHAGEDFEHILCGIRAVHEAIFFLDMSNGDRIGHATALGIAPAQCSNELVHCSRGKWLDTLVWLTWIIKMTPTLAADFGGEIARLQLAIASLYLQIYERTCPELPILWKAWELRKYDVQAVCDEKLALHGNSQCEQRCLEKEKATAGEKIYTMAKEELRRYHAAHHRKSWKKAIKLTAEELPGDSLLLALQDAIITEMAAKNILVEVLPTSNVRISYYTATDQHHVMRWLNNRDHRPAPQVVLGTDDPGIFSTTLRNEYGLILHKLKSIYQAESERPYEIIRHLVDNGKSYRFRPQ